MFDEVKVLAHSSIKINGEKVLYFDPYTITEESHDADVIFVTHSHYDHYSPEDIRKVAKADTMLILPECMRGQAEKDGSWKVEYLKPGDFLETGDLHIRAVPAYNRIKPFHTKGKGFVGYLVTMKDTVYYVAGDTDRLPENGDIKCDVALVPVGGTYTMDYKEAAKLVNEIKPRLAIPTHYGTVAGKKEDGRRFAESVDKGIEVRVELWP